MINYMVKYCRFAANKVLFAYLYTFQFYSLNFVEIYLPQINIVEFRFHLLFYYFNILITFLKIILLLFDSIPRTRSVNYISYLLYD